VATQSGKPLDERLAKARREGRTQTALDLAKQLAKQTPTPENRAILRDIILERAEQLLREGKPKDANVVLNNAHLLTTDPETRARLAARLAQAGDVTQAQAMVPQLPEGPHRAKVIAHLADTALSRGEAGRALLPAELHLGFDAVLRAFASYQKADDDAARETLQSIGLTSPFLEWRVLIRGLSAYSKNDDVRARENWQRLDPERLPWRLVAPFRFRLDVDFRAAQPPETQKRLQSILDRTTTASPIAALRGLEKFLHQEKDDILPQIFRQADVVLPLLKQHYPSLLPRFARALYAAVIRLGFEEDVATYRRMMPPLPDDPHLNLLAALQFQNRDEKQLAATAWLRYEKEVAELSSRFPGPTGKHARAMIWERIGHLGAEAKFTPGLGPLDRTVPSPEACFRKSVELAPSRKSAHKHLVMYLSTADRPEQKTVAAAQAMVKQFPQDASTWGMLGDHAWDAGDFAESERAYAAARRLDPLNAGYRHSHAAVAWEGAWNKAMKAGRKRKAPPDPATFRPALDAALAVIGDSPVTYFADWAILEAKLGNDDMVEQLWQRALARPVDRLAAALAFHLAGQPQKKMSETWKATFANRFEEALKAVESFDERQAALDVIVAWHDRNRQIKGRAELVKRVVSRVTEKSLEKLNEAEVLALAKSLQPIAPPALRHKVFFHGLARFPRNPSFVLLQYDDELDRTGGFGIFGPSPFLLDMLDRARRLAADLPRERQQEILDEIAERQTALDMSSRAGDIFGRFFGGQNNDEDDGW
jgi:hypothetical protein